jgi:hypothetical protein
MFQKNEIVQLRGTILLKDQVSATWARIILILFRPSASLPISVSLQIFCTLYVDLICTSKQIMLSCYTSQWKKSWRIDKTAKHFSPMRLVVYHLYFSPIFLRKDERFKGTVSQKSGWDKALGHGSGPLLKIATGF